MRKILLAAVAILALSGCAQVASGVVSVAQSVSSSTPTQVTTLADALAAATLVTHSVDIAVKTGKVPKGVLIELGVLNDGLHASLVKLEAANAANQSLAIAAFNEALTAFNSYATAQGVNH